MFIRAEEMLGGISPGARYTTTEGRSMFIPAGETVPIGYRLEASASAPASTSTTSSPSAVPGILSNVFGAIIGAGGTFASGFLTSEANKYAAKQQSKSDMFAAMAQERVGIESAKAQERAAGVAQQAETERTAIIVRALTTGAIALAVIGVVGVGVLAATKE